MSKQKIVVLALFVLCMIVQVITTKSFKPLLMGTNPIQVFLAAWLWCMFYNGVR